MTTQLSHINAAGEANMVDVGDKDLSQRVAVAAGVLIMQAANGGNKGQSLAKGRVRGGRVAGIQAAKRCAI